ncbi:MAG: hypothetical protein GY761_01335 [Hyphomicrobiales bacterium]|nr:hypothetical protein [Hyphomicrobiales bacterium]
MKVLCRDWAQTCDKTMIDGLGYLSTQKGAELLNRLSPGLAAKISSLKDLLREIVNI